MGRSYGDVCLNPQGTLWDLRALDRFIAFDEQTGRLRCESGTLLREIQRFGVTRGWMLPVVPGTQYVTVGGAIANDIHGKNHHRYGCFGDHVTQLTLARTEKSFTVCLAISCSLPRLVGLVSPA
jgi:FAD/FMN-containing dehydrogenase